MTAARRTLLEDVNAWALTLLRPVVPPVMKPAPAAGMSGLGNLALLYGRSREPSLRTVRRGRITHLAADWTDLALCGAALAGPLSDAPGARISCPGCALPPEAD